jgi:hypothetical protein
MQNTYFYIHGTLLVKHEKQNINATPEAKRGKGVTGHVLVHKNF